jgi:hypothetical protein
MALSVDRRGSIPVTVTTPVGSSATTTAPSGDTALIMA